jgi:hypothetical protein
MRSRRHSGPGVFAGKTCVQSVPSQIQVSLNESFGPTPPNITVVPRVATIEAPARTDGVCAGNFCVQLVP